MSLKASEWVEVRSKDEILQTLDRKGRLEGMPFMPQMFQYCGKQFKVYKRAHKTCDPVYTVAARRLSDAVHLDLRCDGKAYGGCQAGCLLFWKEAWLKPVRADVARTSSAREEAAVWEQPAKASSCTVEDVWNATRVEGGQGAGDKHYVCQITQLPDFTKALPWWSLTQYFEDYTSSNVTLSELLRGGIYVLFGRYPTRVAPIRRIYNGFQALTGGMTSPVNRGVIPLGHPQPTVELDLQPGDLVRVKSHEEILATIDKHNRNRSLLFDVEMVPFCGGVYRVRTRVDRFIDEKTGRIKSLKTPAVILEGVFCRSCFSDRRMFCPRALYSWWREVWLERVSEANIGKADRRLHMAEQSQMGRHLLKTSRAGK